MSYSATKVYTLNASSTSLADILAALITHFTAAPGLWQLTPSVAPVATEAFSIRAKASPTCDIVIRRIGTSTGIGVTLDPDKAITDVGDISNEPSGSLNASPECKTGSMSGYSTRFFVVEYSDALLVLFQDSTKSFTPYGLHMGRIYDAARVGDAALGLDGHGALVGQINTSGTNAWSGSSEQVDGSRVRVFDVGGEARWAQAEFVDMCLSNSSSWASMSADGALKSPRPLALKGSYVNGSYDLFVGLTRWLAGAPLGTSPAFPNANPRNLIQSSTDEAWIFIRNSASLSGFTANWERGISPT